MTKISGSEAAGQPGINESELISIKKREIIKLLVISDTHRTWSYAARALALFPDTDLILHLGDHEDDYAVLREKLGKPLIAVSGNCDHQNLMLPIRKLLTLPDYRILMVHGHEPLINVKSGLTMLKRFAVTKEIKADLVLFGHTHQQYQEYLSLSDKPLRLLNPGTCGSDGKMRALRIILRSGNIDIESIQES